MTYTPPAQVARNAGRLLRKGADFEEVTNYVAAATAVDVVNMTAAALSAVEQHDPACTGLWDNDEPCDCSWARIETVVGQLRDKVQASP